MTYALISILVSPSSKMDQFFLATLAQIWGNCNHSLAKYCTKLNGMEGSVEISSQRFKKFAILLDFTQALTLSHSSRN